MYTDRKDNKSFVPDTVQKKQTNGVYLDDNRQSTIQRKENDTPIQFARGDKYKKTTSDYVDDFLHDEYEDEQIEDELYGEDDEYIDGPDVYNAWDPSSDWNSAIAAQVRNSQDYTVTFQWSVLGYTLRAHVHYIYQNGGYNKIAGHGWVRGIDGYEFRTPATMVINAPIDPTTI